MSEQSRVVYVGGQDDLSYLPDGFVAVSKGSVVIEPPVTRIPYANNPTLEETPEVYTPQIDRNSFATSLYKAQDGTIYGSVTFDVDDIDGAESYEVRFT